LWRRVSSEWTLRTKEKDHNDSLDGLLEIVFWLVENINFYNFGVVGCWKYGKNKYFFFSYV